MSTDRRNRSGSDDGSDAGEIGDERDNRSSEAKRDNAVADAGERAQSGEQRDVIVPRELYKIITVFSTLIAIMAVVGGFVLLDTATNRTLAAASEVNLPLAILGVGSIVLGAAVYAFASRFRTRGMGSPNNGPDEP